MKNHDKIQSDAQREGFALFATSEQLKFPDLSDAEFMAELGLLSQDATVFVLSRVAQVLHFCGELDQVRQLEVADLFFNRHGVRRVREAFQLGSRCFASYEGATRLALLSVMHSPHGIHDIDRQAPD